MKQTLLTSALFFLSFFVFRKVQLPQKEETIEWINSKIDSYPSQYYDFDGWAYDYSTYSSFLKLYKTHPEYESKTYEINFSDITYVGSKKYSGSTNFNCFLLFDRNSGEFPVWLNWSGEVDLWNRFEKALKAIVQYNIPDEKY